MSERDVEVPTADGWGRNSMTGTPRAGGTERSEVVA